MSGAEGRSDCPNRVKRWSAKQKEEGQLAGVGAGSAPAGDLTQTLRDLQDLVKSFSSTCPMAPDLVSHTIVELIPIMNKDYFGLYVYLLNLFVS